MQTKASTTPRTLAELIADKSDAATGEFCEQVSTWLDSAKGDAFFSSDDETRATFEREAMWRLASAARECATVGELCDYIATVLDLLNGDRSDAIAELFERELGDRCARAAAA